MIFITDVSHFLNNDLFDAGCKLLDKARLKKTLAIKSDIERCRSLCGGLLVRLAYACYRFPKFMTRMSESILKEADVFPADTQFLPVNTGIGAPDTELDISKMTQVTPGNLLFEWTMHEQMPSIVVLNEGKPIVDGCHNFHFSISHSGDLAIVIYGEIDLGIDLQEFRRLKNAVFNRVISDKEKMKFEESLSLHFDMEDTGDILKSIDKTPLYAITTENDTEGEVNVTEALYGKNEGNKSYTERICDYFFRCWCAKESYMKLTGEGMTRAFDSICYDVDTGVIECEGELAKCHSAVFMHKNNKYAVSVAWR